MAKTVADAALMLGALEGPAPDPRDPATNRCTLAADQARGNYSRSLRADGLKGARIGIPRAYFYDRVTPPGEFEPRGGLTAEQAASMTEAIAALKQQGAIVVDPANIPSVVDPDPSRNFLRWGICSGADEARGRDAGCAIGLKYGMKRDFNAWLASLGVSGAGQEPDRAARVERGARAGRHPQVRPVEPRYLRRDGRRARPRALRRGPGEGPPAGRQRTGSTK